MRVVSTGGLFFSTYFSPCRVRKRKRNLHNSETCIMLCWSNSIASGRRRGEYYNSDINFRSGESFLRDTVSVFLLSVLLLLLLLLFLGEYTNIIGILLNTLYFKQSYHNMNCYFMYCKYKQEFTPIYCCAYTRNCFSFASQ